MQPECIWDSQILWLCTRPLTSREGVSTACRELMMHGRLTLQNSQHRGKGAGGRSSTYSFSPFGLSSIHSLCMFWNYSTWRNNHTCKTCAYLEIARNSSLCSARIQEIKAGWFMAFYCTSWPLLMFSSLRNGKSCSLDFYCAVHQPSPQPPSLFFLSWVNLLGV